MVKAPRWLRAVVAFAIAPISPGLVVVILFTPFLAEQFFFDPHFDSHKVLAGAAFYVGLSAALGYPIAIVLGVPLYALFRLRGWNRWPTYVMAGAVLGLMIYAYNLVGMYNARGMAAVIEEFSHRAAIWISLGMICGAIAGLFFWLIARPDRP